MSLLQAMDPLLQAGMILAVAAGVGLLLRVVLLAVLRRLTTRLPGVLVFQGVLLDHVKRPLWLLLPLIVVGLTLPLVEPQVPETYYSFLTNVLYILAVGGVAWILVGAVGAFDEVVAQRYDVEAADNLEARKALTQAKILKRILEGAEEWDERAAAVQVTDAKERTVEVRLLQSAPSAPALFTLRCQVREKMIAFVQDCYPEALPRLRAELPPTDGRDRLNDPPDGEGITAEGSTDK